MKYLLDTMVLKEIGRPDPHRNVSAWLATVDDAEIAISVITVGETWKGVERLRQRRPDAADLIAVTLETVLDAFGSRVIASTGKSPRAGPFCSPGARNMSTIPASPRRRSCEISSL